MVHGEGEILNIIQKTAFFGHLSNFSASKYFE